MMCGWVCVTKTNRKITILVAVIDILFYFFHP